MMRSLISFFRACIPLSIIFFISTSVYAFDEPVPSITTFTPPCGYHYVVKKCHHVRTHHKRHVKHKCHKRHKIHREVVCYCVQPCDQCMMPQPVYRCVREYSYHRGRNCAAVDICTECP